MNSRILLDFAVTVGFGALAGGITNAIAIWMLFHPHEPRGLGRFRIQGAIPKNRPRLAKTIGRTVGERLLTPQDLGAQRRSPGVQEGFDHTVRRLVQDLLTTEWGPLCEELPQPLAGELEQMLLGLGDSLAGRLADLASTEEFPEKVADGLARAAPRSRTGRSPGSSPRPAARRSAPGWRHGWPRRWRATISSAPSATGSTASSCGRLRSRLPRWPASARAAAAGASPRSAGAPPGAP